MYGYTGVQSNQAHRPLGQQKLSALSALSALCSLLSALCFLLSRLIAIYPLLCRPQFRFYCLLSALWYVLCAVCYLLPSGCCLQSVVCCLILLYDICCLVSAVSCPPFDAIIMKRRPPCKRKTAALSAYFRLTFQGLPVKMLRTLLRKQGLNGGKCLEKVYLDYDIILFVACET
jgi:hypothetical protein